MLRTVLRCTLLCSAALVCACGGGDDAPPAEWHPGEFPASSTLKARCAAPRGGTDPYTGQAYGDQAGSILAEQLWLRSWSHELYLWYNELPDPDPSSYSGTLDYFDALKTAQRTASGAAKDHFHFTYPTPVWERISQQGSEAGYGAQWAILHSSPPRDVRVAYTEPGSPATAAGAALGRGAQVLAIDGVDVIYANSQQAVDTINAGLFPDGAGEHHVITVRDRGSNGSRAISLTSVDVVETPVQAVHTIDTPTGRVGYLLFNDHVTTAEQALSDAFTTLRDAGIADLVLDLRYNGGGYLDIASEAAYMIAGSARTAGRTFERVQFNDQHPTINPVTGDAIAPVPFHDAAVGFSLPENQPLPSVNLPRVFVLSGSRTCSASEAIINGLRGVGVQVIQIGATTCGKPYGFYPEDNCGTTYFSIEFRGVNAANFGDYTDGFSPGSFDSGATVRGCSVADDFDHDLGDSAEARLAAALNYRSTGACPAAAAKSFEQPVEPEMRRSPWHENRILRKPGTRR